MKLPRWLSHIRMQRFDIRQMTEDLTFAQILPPREGYSRAFSRNLRHTGHMLRAAKYAAKRDPEGAKLGNVTLFDALMDDYTAQELAHMEETAHLLEQEAVQMPVRIRERMAAAQVYHEQLHAARMRLLAELSAYHAVR